MFLRKSKVAYCLYVVLTGAAIVGVLWTLWTAGLFGTKQRTALDPDALKAALEAVRTKQRAELIGQLADAAHFNSKRLERLSSMAYRLDLLEASGFLAFASQARYQIDREVYPRGIPTSPQTSDGLSRFWQPRARSTEHHPLESGGFDLPDYWSFMRF
jgi:hypothetical protein